MSKKTYKADSMMEALQLIQNDLGPEAIVLSAREVPLGPAWSKWKRTGVEVEATAAMGLGAAPAGKPASGSPILQADDASQIEWVTPPNRQAGGAPPASKTKSASTESARPWQPRHITREEAQQANQNAGWLSKPVEHPTLSAITKGGREESPLPPLITPLRARQGRGGEEESPLNKGGEGGFLPEALQKLQKTLLNQDVDTAFLERTFKVAKDSFSASTLLSDELTRKYLAQLLEAEIRAVSGLMTDPPARILCLVGASGAGKTSAIAKLAMFYGKQLKKAVTWICADTVRTGAVAEARAYTDALGVPLRLAYTPADLKAAVTEATGSDLILIDTPGYNPLDENQMVELGGMLSEVPLRHTYLAASAVTKEKDLFQLSASLGIFNLEGLILTKLDETFTFGNVYNFARRSRLPVVYFTSGKSASAGLEIASAYRLVSSLFSKGWGR